MLTFLLDQQNRSWQSQVNLRRASLDASVNRSAPELPSVRRSLSTPSLVARRRPPVPRQRRPTMPRGRLAVESGSEPASCPICMEPPLYPVSVHCCSKTFCFFCLFCASGPCPCCRDDGVSVERGDFDVDPLSEILVKIHVDAQTLLQRQRTLRERLGGAFREPADIVRECRAAADGEAAYRARFAERARGRMREPEAQELVFHNGMMRRRAPSLVVLRSGNGGERVEERAALTSKSLVDSVRAHLLQAFAPSASQPQIVPPPPPPPRAAELSRPPLLPIVVHRRRAGEGLEVLDDDVVAEDTADAPLASARCRQLIADAGGAANRFRLPSANTRLMLDQRTAFKQMSALASTRARR